MNISFSGSTALVIGGSRGIGAAVCRELAAGGCEVVFTHRGTSPVGEAPGRAELVDVTDDAAMGRLIRSIETLDFLVYCAGVTSPVAFAGLNVEEWRRVVDVNLNGAFIALRHALPLMVKRRRGSVVLIGSAAIVSGGGGRADYASAKAGLEGLNRAVAREYGPDGIRSNLVHPSLIETELLHRRHPDPAKRAKLAQGVPLGRLGQPEDIANMVCFLLSDKAGYITGQSIFVDGGRTFCGPPRR